MREVLDSPDHSIVSVDGDQLCALSPDRQKLSLLQFSSLNNETGDIPSLISAQGQPFLLNTSQSEVSSLAHMMSPPLLDASRQREPTTGFRSPMTLSKDICPANPHTLVGAGLSYSGHRANEDALHSLLGNTPPPANAEPLEKTLSGGLASTIRAQPLLYSRGASSGSSSTAMHIRKKRAGVSTSPRHSDRASPGVVLFDSAWEEGAGSGVDVDISRRGPGQDSPRSGSSGYSFEGASADTIATAITPASALRSAHQQLSARDEHADLLSAAAPEMYVSCLVRVQLPTGIAPGAQVSGRFSGDYDGVVRLIVCSFRDVTKPTEYCSCSLRSLNAERPYATRAGQALGTVLLLQHPQGRVL